MNNSDKFRFVDATAKQIDMNDQLSQPRIGDTAFTIPADPNSLEEGSLVRSYEYLTIKDPRV